MTRIVQDKPKKELSKGDLIRECMRIERSMSQGLEGFVMLKFERGCLLRDVIHSEERYAAGLVEEIADELHCSDKLLYVEHSFAKSFAYDKKLLEAEIESLKAKNIRISFEVFRKQLNPAKNPEVVGGLDNHAEIACQNIEQLAGAIQDANEIHKGNPQVEGAIVAGLEVLQDASDWLVGDTLHPKILKQQKVNLPHYLAWIRTQPCPISGQVAVEAHHLIFRSKGNSGMDLFCIPLSKPLHDEYHKLGHAGFEAKHKVDTRLMVIGYITAYIQEHKK